MNDLCYIIIVSFNNQLETKECIDSLLLSEFKKFKIIVVENSPNNKYYKKLNDDYKSNYKKIKFLKIKNNLGYAHACNKGMKKALIDEKCNWLWILNNDIKVFPDTLSKLILSESKSNNNYIYGNKVLNQNGTIQSLGCTINQLFMSTKHNCSGQDNNNYNINVNNIDYIHGCSIFLNKKIINITGFLEEKYFLFYEDVDYSLSALKKNIKLKIVQESTIIHKENISINKSSNKYLSIINRIHIARKFFPSRIVIVYFGIFLEIIKHLLMFKISTTIKIIKNIIQ